MERPDIIIKRFKYLRQIKDLRCSNRPIIYLDETWVNINHSKNVWMCENSNGELESPLRIPLGKGQRFIVVHAGSESGFVPNALLCFKSSSTKDYHEEMDAVVFKDWFVQKLIPNIPPNSVIVMDNTSYHSKELDKPPTSSTLKADMQEWLVKRNINFDPRSTKPVLYEIIKSVKEKHRQYEIDNLAVRHGHTIVRLPLTIAISTLLN